ncbi:MAG: cytochrome c [Chthoniobacterales bacterium]|nr:cytochrome c [Chthoniobacterales bacterium]
MVQSVRYHARDVRPAAGVNLHDRALAEKVGGAYGLACRTCHGAPGIKPDPWGYLYPPAPDLTRADVVGTWSDAELYWMIKNGIEHTGMIGLGPRRTRKRKNRAIERNDSRDLFDCCLSILRRGK